MALGLGGGSGLGRRACRLHPARPSEHARPDVRRSCPESPGRGRLLCSYIKSSAHHRQAILAKLALWTAKSVDGTVGFRRLYGSGRDVELDNPTPSVIVIFDVSLEHVGSRGFDTGLVPRPTQPAVLASRGECVGRVSTAVCLRSTDALPRQASPPHGDGSGHEVSTFLAAAPRTLNLVERRSRARLVQPNGKTSGDMPRRWRWRPSCGGGGDDGTALHTPRPSRPRAVRRELVLDVADNDDLALDDHHAILGAGVVGGPLPTPAERLDLERVHVVGKLDSRADPENSCVRKW